jgi:hypothetical protein
VRTGFVRCICSDGFSSVAHSVISTHVRSTTLTPGSVYQQHGLVFTYRRRVRQQVGGLRGPPHHVPLRLMCGLIRREGLPRSPAGKNNIARLLHSITCLINKQQQATQSQVRTPTLHSVGSFIQLSTSFHSLLALRE